MWYENVIWKCFTTMTGCDTPSPRDADASKNHN